MLEVDVLIRPVTKVPLADPWVLELWQAPLGMASNEPASELVHLALVEVVDASQSTSRKMSLLVVVDLPGCGFGGWAGVVGVDVGSAIGGGSGAVPLMKLFGIPLGVVGGAFFTTDLVEAGRAGSLLHKSPCTCGGVRG